MATVRKITYKVHCTPQEKIHFSGGSGSGRWYLDSDCGRKLTGEATQTFGTDANDVVYTANQAIGDSNVVLASASGDGDGSNDVYFLYVKNTGGGSGDDISISPSQDCFGIGLSSGEAFVGRIKNTDNQIDAICSSGKDTTIEYIVAREG